MNSAEFEMCSPCIGNDSIKVLDKVYTHIVNLEFWSGPDKVEIQDSIENVCNTINELKNQIENLKKHVKPKKEKPPRVQCPFKTAKGSQCRKYCMDGAETCKVHSKPLKAKKVTKIPRAKRQACTGINIRGNPCRNKCLEGKTYCERHDPDALPTTKKTKRNKKRETPMHTHAPGENPTERCILCETHGDMFDPHIVDHEILETPGSCGLTLRMCIDKKIEGINNE